MENIMKSIITIFAIAVFSSQVFAADPSKVEVKKDPTLSGQMQTAAEKKKADDAKKAAKKVEVKKDAKKVEVKKDAKKEEVKK